MFADFRLLICSVAAIALIVVGVFTFPPLTSGGSTGADGFSQIGSEAVFSAELAYCRDLPGGIDCECFASKSGSVLSHDAPQVHGAIYANKRDLARGQAANSC